MPVPFDDSSGSSLVIAMPVMNESHSLKLVLGALEKQTDRDFSLVVCVNQPDEWWDREEKIHVCTDNAVSLSMLGSWRELPLVLIDRSSRGQGWHGRKHGVGWARKTALDAASRLASPEGVLISYDADTLVNPEFTASVRSHFHLHPQMNTLSIPYFHPLTGQEPIDRAILRYEIYMRYYALNLWRIQSPHAFTALGSAIAVRNSAYKAVRGISPRLSGEDFYFLQKMVKYGHTGHWNEEWVYPASRTSDRVYFGTGPAVTKGLTGDWSSYPFYNSVWFDEVAETFSAFPALFPEDIPTPMSSFLEEIFSGEIWSPLRKNFITQESFIRACSDRIDGLRILQYLKSKNRMEPMAEDLRIVSAYVCTYHPSYADLMPQVKAHYLHETIENLDLLRRMLTDIESDYRKIAVVK